MKKAIIVSALFSAFALASMNASAATDTLSPIEVKKIKESLKKNHADMPTVDSVRLTQIPGVVEVVVNRGEVFYASKDGATLLFGNMVVSQNGKQVSLTEKRTQELSAMDFKTFNLKDALVRKIGNGTDKIVTFEDPRCPYCQKLQPEFEKLQNVTIYTFVVPILGEPSMEASKKIMCSSDNVKAWEAYMGKNHIVPTISEGELAKCDTSALERNIAFARKYKIQGTPAIFFENGRAIKGYAKAENIMDVMKQPKK